MSRFTIFMAMFTLVGAGCIRRQTQPVEPERPIGPASPAIQKPADSQPMTPSVGASQIDATVSAASFPIALDEEALKKHVKYVDALRYHFVYGVRDVTDDIAFANGKALIEINNLPVGITSDLSLEILENNVVTLKGVIKDLKLKPSENRLPLKLSPVGNADTADLTINIDQPDDPSAVPPGDPSDPDDDTGGDDDNAIGTGIDNSNFATELKPIFDKHCAECHHAGAQAPNLSLPPSKSQLAGILQHVTNKTMPPAPRDPLSSQNIDKIKAWQSAP